MRSRDQSFGIGWLFWFRIILMKIDLRSRILQLLRAPRYQPLDKVELSKKIGLSSDERGKLRALLQEMERCGEIARIRKDRYVIPAAADLCTGILQVHASGGAHVLCETGGADLYVSAENTGVAMNGDRVVARTMTGGVGRRGRPAQKEGSVIRILERAHDTIVGTLQQSKNFFYVVPDDTRLVHNVYVRPLSGAAQRPREEVQQPETAAVIGDKVVVRLEEWKSRNINPEGEIIEVLGPAGAPGVDMLSIIRKHHLPTTFPDAVLHEAEKISETIDDREVALREDLRAQMIVTIDPDDAKDFDDAIHVERVGDGWRLGVHIADVSHYVRPGSALDREAFERGNSVYLVDRVIPMLPEKLSNGVCSLKPHVDRLTQSVFIDFTRAGKIKSARFGRSVIRSAHRFTYKEAFAALQKPAHDALTERLHTAWELAALLRKNRFAHGSLDLDFPEVKVWLDGEGKPARLEKLENDISHQLVEEFMLAANETVAREIKNRQVPGVYRIHDNPDKEKLAEF
ncbi:MAG: ribonuclease, partial [Chthoniobacter sp.]|nr:ribonuclease [Chthoniobacter sp.]